MTSSQNNLEWEEKKEKSFKDYLIEKLEWCDWPNSSLELVRCKKLEEVDGFFGVLSPVDADDDKNIWWFFHRYYSPDLCNVKFVKDICTYKSFKGMLLQIFFEFKQNPIRVKCKTQKLEDLSRKTNIVIVISCEGEKK